MEKPNHLIESEDAIPSKFIYDRQLEPIPFTMHLFRTFKEQGKDAESLAWLYLFYYSCARQQGTDSIFAVNSWTCKMLNWGEKKLKRIKAKLKKLGCITYITQKNSEGKIIAHFIYVRFVYHLNIQGDEPQVSKMHQWTKNQRIEKQTYDVETTGAETIPMDTKTTGVETTPMDIKTTGAKNHRVENDPPILKETNKNSLRNDNEEEEEKRNQQEKDFPVTGKTYPAKEIKSIEIKTNGYISPDMFERFWKIYPRKDSQGKSKIVWDKICLQKNESVPTWLEIKKAIWEQKESERWKSNEKFIPLPSTWLKEKRWLDNANDLKDTSLVVKDKTTPVQQKKDFLDQIIDIFCEEYGDYKVVCPGKERQAASKILQLHKKEFPDYDSEQMLLSLRVLFNRCVNIQDRWLNNNMSLSIIASRFNEIVKTIKNETKGTTEQELLTTLGKHFTIHSNAISEKCETN